MKTFKWQHIQFADGSNPYICMTEKNFKWMQKHYNLVKIKDGFWLADNMDRQYIEDKLFDFFSDKMMSGDAPKIEVVRRFKGYLCTMDNGIIIDCTDGTQIRLIIQTA